jgi:hypothetical protein
VPIQLGSHIIKTTLLVLGLESVGIILGTLILPSPGSTQSCAFSMTELPLKKIPVVCEYADVFPDELLGMPPDWDIEFTIELQPGTAPISKRPYQMPPR